MAGDPKISSLLGAQGFKVSRLFHLGTKTTQGFRVRWV